MPRAYCVEKVPAFGWVKMSLPSLLFLRNQKFESELDSENFFSLLARAGSPLIIQNWEPLPGLTPAKSSEVATVSGVPVWNCDTAEIAQPPRTFPVNAD